MRLLCAVLLLALATGAPLRAQAAAPPEAQRRLEQVRQERGRLASEVTRMQSRARTLTGEIESIDRMAGSSAQALDELAAQLGDRNDQVIETARDLLATRDQLGDRRAILHRRLRTIYKRGPLNAVEVLLTARSFGELINRYKYLVLVARYDRQLVREVAALESQLAGRERLLQRTLTSLQDEQAERSITYDQLGGMRSERESALAAATRRQQAATRRIAQLEADERSLRSVLAGLERARTAPGATTPLATLTTRDLGALAWPVEGSVLYRFGRATQENGTAIRWNGLGIAAALGTPVRAVEQGTVAMAGPFEGYGPSVLVSHGGGYYSLYLYLQRVVVRQGETVARGQSVGTVGGTGTPEGAHIEFQIRGPTGEAVDPLAWLQAQGAR